ncbi:Sodium/hydrogen exchanger family-domain-containing protein, partial [Crucibulum laeve]
MPEFSNTVISLFQKRAAPEQGGLLSGKDPSAFNPVDPIRLWIIQVGVIVCTATLLSLLLRKIRQPKVIAEVLGGILLGPTAFGRIPGFTQHIFPKDSQPYLSLVANIGLCLFLFLVGLEIDAGIIKRNARLSATVALAGMVLPFGFGAALAVPLYHQFIDPSIKFTHFMLFTGVAYSITAFPVLCRILTELKLLDTTVGIVVLSAGVGNDIIGWTLLALSVALVNGGAGVTALYILLCCLGWTLFLLFPVKMALKWLARKTGSIESGPSVFYMTVIMMVLFGSAFFTDVIGVHAIFGAFVAGLIVPREGGLAIALTEKLEDMVSILFLPLYFTLSGLSTDLGLLDNGITWGYTIAIMVLAFTGKFGGCCLAAHYGAGFSWRESSTIGSLMSCKGLVELIVLNVGLSAGILSQRVFSMFVLEALVLTFMTTPLVTWLYPPQFRTRISATGANFNNVADDEARDKRPATRDGAFRTRFTVVLDKIEHLPGMMALTQLVHPAAPPSPVAERSKDRRGEQRASTSTNSYNQQSITYVEALRLIELSDRVSAVMKSSVSEAVQLADPVLSVFRMFAQLNDIRITPSMSIVQYDELSYSVAEHAKNFEADMIMIPWLPPTYDVYDGNLAQQHAPRERHEPTTTNLPRSPSNPFDIFFKSTSSLQETSAPEIHSHFVRGVFSRTKTDVALYIDQNTPGSTSGGSTGSQQHLFLPFFGGPDDRLALEFVVQVCTENLRVTATVLRIVRRDVDAPIRQVDNAQLKDGRNMEEINNLTVASGVAGFPDTVYGQHNTETRLQSETADNIAWARYASRTSDSRSISSAGGRIEFREMASPIPLHAAIQEATAEAERTLLQLLIVTGRSRRLAVENHLSELKGLMEEHRHVSSEVRKTVGDVATGFVVAGCGSGVVVLQAAMGDA